MKAAKCRKKKDKTMNTNNSPVVLWNAARRAIGLDTLVPGQSVRIVVNDAVCIVQGDAGETWEGPTSEWRIALAEALGIHDNEVIGRVELAATVLYGKRPNGEVMAIPITNRTEAFFAFAAAWIASDSHTSDVALYADIECARYVDTINVCDFVR